MTRSMRSIVRWQHAFVCSSAIALLSAMWSGKSIRRESRLFLLDLGRARALAHDVGGALDLARLAAHQRGGEPLDDRPHQEAFRRVDGGDERREIGRASCRERV